LDLVAQGKLALGIYRASPSANFPKPVFGILVSHGDVVGFFETVRNLAPVLFISEELGELRSSRAENLLAGHGLGVADHIEGVSKVPALRRAVCRDDVPECSRLRRRRLRVKASDIQGSQIGRDVTQAAGLVPSPQSGEVVGIKILFRQLGPGDVVASVVVRQINAVCLVVGVITKPVQLNTLCSRRCFSSTRITSGGAAV